MCAKLVKNIEVWEWNAHFFLSRRRNKKATIDLDILWCKLILLHNDLWKLLLEGSERLRLCPRQRGQSKSSTLDDVGRGRFGGFFG